MLWLMFQRDEVLQLALKSNDMLFHSALYDWLFSNNRSDKLLEVSVADDSDVHSIEQMMMSTFVGR